MIREANESDLPCLAAALVRLQDAHVEAYPEVYRRFEVGDARSFLSDLLANPDVFVRVATSRGAVVGHAVFRTETSPASLFKHPQRFGHISQIEVEPSARRNGVGRALLEDCERLAVSHGLHRIVLDVWAFNHAAKSFFQSNGYDGFGFKLSRLMDEVSAS